VVFLVRHCHIYTLVRIEFYDIMNEAALWLEP
jgi:hypothetical protein